MSMSRERLPSETRRKTPLTSKTFHRPIFIRTETYCEADSIPSEFICAIDKTLLVAPVIDYPGFTYNLPALNATIASQVKSPNNR